MKVPYNSSKRIIYGKASLPTNTATPTGNIKFRPIIVGSLAVTFIFSKMTTFLVMILNVEEKSGNHKITRIGYEVSKLENITEIRF